MVKPRNTTGKGYFQVKGAEPLAKKALHVRLPESLDAEVRRIANGDLSGWLRKVIAQAVAQEKLLDE